MIELTYTRANELFEYTPETGVVRRRIDKRSGRPGGPAGCMDKGYTRTLVDGRRYLNHRLAWLLYYGVWPTMDIDHINGITHDNRICNLRDVTTAMNIQNQKKARSGSLLGLLGVSVHREKFQAHIRTHGALKHIGLFATPEEAHEAYLTAKRELHDGCTI